MQIATRTASPVPSTPVQGVAPYSFGHATSRGTAAWYLEPVVDALLPGLERHSRILDVGCGNGYWAGRLLQRGAEVVGIDPSESGIAEARRAYSGARFEVGVVQSDLCTHLEEDPFDLVVSFEVVEHLYAPHQWAEACFASLRPGGTLICSTPYHGYLKNLLLALFGKWDHHHQPLKDGGHVKFWCRQTLQRLLTDAGFTDLRFRGAGRHPYLWKSMVMQARKPVLNEVKQHGDPPHGDGRWVDAAGAASVYGGPSNRFRQALARVQKSCNRRRTDGPLPIDQS